MKWCGQDAPPRPSGESRPRAQRPSGSGACCASCPTIREDAPRAPRAHPPFAVYLERVAHRLAHERLTGLELVEQLDPRRHHRIGTVALTLFGSHGVGAPEVAQELGAQTRREGLQGLRRDRRSSYPWSAPPYRRVTLWVTLRSSCTVAVRPDESRLSALTCTDGQGRDIVGRARMGRSPSQGGDTGSNPVGTTCGATFERSASMPWS